MTNPYIIGFKRASFTQLLRLDRKIAESIIQKLLQLARSVETVQHYALTGQWKGCFKLRVGDYRVIYSLEAAEKLIVVEALGHRGEIYDE